jgi:hypothetical protein
MKVTIIITFALFIAPTAYASIPTKSPHLNRIEKHLHNPAQALATSPSMYKKPLLHTTIGLGAYAATRHTTQWLIYQSAQRTLHAIGEEFNDETRSLIPVSMYNTIEAGVGVLIACFIIKNIWSNFSNELRCMTNARDDLNRSLTEIRRAHSTIANLQQSVAEQGATITALQEQIKIFNQQIGAINLDSNKILNSQNRIITDLRQEEVQLKALQDLLQLIARKNTLSDDDRIKVITATSRVLAGKPMKEEKQHWWNRIFNH